MRPTAGGGPQPEHDSGPGLTRRGVLAGGAAVGLGVGLDRLIGLPGGASHKRRARRASATVPFHGSHQAGVATPAQQYLYFAAFDVMSTAVSDVRELLVRWTQAASTLTAGAPYQSLPTPAGQAPLETGEAFELDAAQLTLTFGFGPTLFASGGSDRFGLARQCPSELKALPPFRGESLQAGRCGGDLCVQACAEDPQVAFHAVHVLQRIANGTAALRWTQLGFGRTSSTSRAQATPRNLMGFKDGTNNIRAEDARAMDRHVWAQPGDGPAWMSGGTYLIARRIKFLFDVWDATTLEGQERSVGRHKLSGAPLGASGEYDPVDLRAVSGGQPVIPTDAHIRVASAANNEGQRILRRGYSFSEAPETGSGALEAGLFFIAFQRRPREFIAIQRRLAAGDALNRHALHTSSAIFACPPGASRGKFVGEGLFA